MGQLVITVAQQKGGAGKTTIAAHLAVALTQKGYRVAVVDIDPQGSLTHWHRLREELFGEGYTGLYFTALSGWRVGSEVARLRRSYDIIIIDSPPHVETEARTAIRSADLILVPVQPSPTDLWATKATVDLAKAEGKAVRTIMNRVNPTSKIFDLIRAELSDVATTKLNNRVVFASALMEGRGVTEIAPASPAATEIKMLASEVLEFMPQEIDSFDFAAQQTQEQPTMVQEVISQQYVTISSENTISEQETAPTTKVFKTKTAAAKSTTAKKASAKTKAATKARTTKSVVAKAAAAKAAAVKKTSTKTTTATKTTTKAPKKVLELV